MTRNTKLAWLTGVAAFAVACSGTPQTPLSPSAGAPGTLADSHPGSGLKASAPAPSSPASGVTLENRRPTFTWQAARGTYIALSGVTYRIVLLNEDGSTAAERTVVDATSIDAEADLEYEKNYSWQVRAEIGGQTTAWSGTATFRTPNRPTAGGAPLPGGTVGPQRTIGFDEAYAIIRNIYDTMRFNIGRSSTRENRNLYIAAATAAIYYGHPRFNPAGPDPSWCIKDAGAGRPQADDVLVYCPTREAWDLVISMGGDGWQWHADYLGRLPGSQNVYAPPASALNILN